MAGKLLMIKFVKMKKKIIFAVATGFFAVATVVNMNMLQGNSAGDVSLESIEVMALANGEVQVGPFCSYVCECTCFVDVQGLTTIKLLGVRQYF